MDYLKWDQLCKHKLDLHWFTVQKCKEKALADSFIHLLAVFKNIMSDIFGSLGEIQELLSSLQSQMSVWRISAKN